MIVQTPRGFSAKRSTKSIREFIQKLLGQVAGWDWLASAWLELLHGLSRGLAPLGCFGSGSLDPDLTAENLGFLPWQC